MIKLKNDMEGKLFICPTPIGNLDDITIRTLNTLKEADLIAAEDTRHTIKLLNHFDIKKPLTSYHEHNIKEKGPVIIDKILKGKNVALVSDAGMPAISDPGEDLVKLAVESNIDIIALPGATASILALVLSGLSTDKFVFEGFLPAKSKDRKESLEKLKTEERTLIFYESPHRLLALLKDMFIALGDRNIAVARELTKKYEEVYRGSIQSAIEKFDSEGPRGEFVIVVQGMSSEIIKEIEESMWSDMTIKEHIILYVNQGFRKKEAIKRVAKERNIPKNEVYKESIGI
ncbi:16S rRNA (cytidine(1402)-2'-O)-methyltransferase [Sporosalibacterium faouarense]|uniref:16S rRNA (cytidine(1402)-2'-O)-methyltransferase n=1 Tax=Sporosalibacterium faouarense TaxID=516123 RepID=UPI003C72F46E